MHLGCFLKKKDLDSALYKSITAIKEVSVSHESSFSLLYEESPLCGVHLGLRWLHLCHVALPLVQS